MTQIDKAISGPVVSINYKPEKGLQLNWNTKGMIDPTRNNTIKHLIILQNQQDQGFISTYYKKMKLGDLLGVLYQGKQKSKFRMKWHQKCYQVTDIQPFIKNNYVVQKNIVQILSKLIKSYKNQPQLMFIIIFPTIQTNQIVEFVQDIRLKGIDNVIFNLFDKNNYTGDFADLMDGIYYWKYYDSKDVLNVCNSIRMFTSLITLSRMTIRIRSLNKTFLSQNKNDWRNIDFYTIQKAYYGVFSFECVQTILFVQHKSQNDFFLDLVLQLNYKLLNGKQIVCKKQITLKNDNSRIYQRSQVVKQENLKQYYLTKDFTIFSNFSKKQAIISVQDVIQNCNSQL